MAEVLAYTVSCRNNEIPAKVSTTLKGLYLTKSNAENALKLQAEEFCIDRVGLLNFVKDQLDSNQHKATITDGFALVNDGGIVKVVKRVPYIRGYTYTETVFATFEVLSLCSDKITVFLPTGEREVIKDEVDVLGFVQAVKRVPGKQSSKKKCLPFKNPEEPLSLVEKMLAELKVAVAKRSREMEGKIVDDIVQKLPIEKPIETVSNELSTFNIVESAPVKEETLPLKDSMVTFSEAKDKLPLIIETISSQWGKSLVTAELTDFKWDFSHLEKWEFDYENVSMTRTMVTPGSQEINATAFSLDEISDKFMSLKAINGDKCKIDLILNDNGNITGLMSFQFPITGGLYEVIHYNIKLLCMGIVSEDDTLLKSE